MFATILSAQFLGHRAPPMKNARLGRTRDMEDFGIFRVFFSSPSSPSPMSSSFPLCDLCVSSTRPSVAAGAAAGNFPVNSHPRRPVPPLAANARPQPRATDRRRVADQSAERETQLLPIPEPRNERSMDAAPLPGPKYVPHAHHRRHHGAGNTSSLTTGGLSRLVTVWNENSLRSVQTVSAAKSRGNPSFCRRRNSCYRV